MTPILQHPLSCAFPAMPAEDFAALCADIKAHGLIQPIVLFEGQVIDGWHRYKACIAADIEARSSLLPDGADPVAFVLACNLHRRHMTASQRAMAIVTCSNWRPNGLTNVDVAVRVAPGATLSNEQMAAAADVSKRTISQAKVVAAEAAPEVVEAVKTGKVSVKAAAEATAKAKPAAKTKPASKPAAKKAAKPEEAPDGSTAKDFEADDMRAGAEALAAENSDLKDRLAVAAMDATPEERHAAAELIAQLHEDIRLLEVENDTIKSQRDTLMVENAELKKTVAYWRRQASKVAA